MINDKVIQEIYKRYKKPPRNPGELNLSYFQALLSTNNPIQVKDDMVEITNIEQFSPFKRFLIRSINAILEFESTVAFVFSNRILFLNIQDSDVHVHLKPEKKKKLFGLF